MTSPLLSPVCVPDVYLTEERLRVLFSEFSTCLSHAVPRESIFANIVNSVRQLYVSQILVLQQDLVSQATPQESDMRDQLDRQLAAQHDRLTAQHEQHVAELAERHNQQLRGSTRGRELEATPSRWIVGIDVVYGEELAQKPPDRIMEFTGNADNMNSDFGGKRIWLVPRWDTDPTNALTGVGISIQAASNDCMSSVARGAAGKYRYIHPQYVKGAKKIYCMNLLRPKNYIEGPPVGYDGSTMNINDGRDGRLYLIWKSWSV